MITLTRYMMKSGREDGLVLAAKNMIAQGLPVDVIMQVTGLSEAQLEKL